MKRLFTPDERSGQYHYCEKMMLSSLRLLVFVFYFIAAVVLAIPGGWNPAPVNDANVIAAAKYVVHEKPISSIYNGRFRVVSAESQVDFKY